MFLLISGVAPLIAAAQNTFDGTSNFILLTLPFFIWAGLIMEKGGISLRLVRFAMTLVGHMRGGLLQVVVLTIYMVSGISGSKIADVVAVGSVLRRELKKQGYRPEQGAAVLASSAAMSETIPPSLAMLVLGSVAPISIGTLFIAGPAAGGGHRAAADDLELRAVAARQHGRGAACDRGGTAARHRRRDTAAGDAGHHGDRHPLRGGDADRSLERGGAVWIDPGFRDLSRGRSQGAVHDRGRILPAGGNGAVHHRRGVLVCLDADRGQSAGQPCDDPAFDRRQPHRVHAWARSCC